MTNIEINEIREYAAQKGYALRHVEIREDSSCHVKIEKIDAGSVGVWESEFGFSDFQTFKKEFSARTKLIRKNGRKYVKKIKAKDNKSLREIKKYKKNNIRAKNMQNKYTDIFMLAFEQIKDSFESHDSNCSDILECYSEHYLSAYNKILQYYWGVSRDANLMELKKSYKYVAKNVLFKYIADLIRIYKENSANEYKNKVFIPNAQLEGASILDRRYRLRYRRLRRCFMHMTVKSAEYVTSFGASHKRVSEKNFFSNYISVSYPSNHEEMSYNQLKNIIMLCVNKNVENEKSKKKIFMLLPAFGVGFDGIKNSTRETALREPEKIIARFTGGSLIKTVLPILMFSLILTSSSLIEWGNPQDVAVRNPVYAKIGGESSQGLGFLPFGIGDLLEAKISLLVNAMSNSKVMESASPETIMNATYEAASGDVKGIGGIGNKHGAGNFGILPVGQNGAQLGGRSTVSQSSLGGSGGVPNNNGFMINSSPERESQDSPPNEATSQGSSPNESASAEAAPSGNITSSSESETNNPMKNITQESVPTESEPQENTSSENIPKENAPNGSEPQENTPNESESQENVPLENPSPENAQNESELEEDINDETPQNQTASELAKNTPTENIPEENSQQDNLAEADQNAVQAEDSQLTYYENDINAEDNPPYTPFTREDFNVPIDFSSNNFFSERPMNLFNPKPPGSLDRNGNPKKNPKTAE